MDSLQWIARYPDFFVFLVLLTAGYALGRIGEARHYQALARREKELSGVTVFSNRFAPELGARYAVALVSGSAVISEDYFKFVVASLQTLFGGRLRSYESLLDRTRREAVLRMKQDARSQAGNMIINVKFESYAIPGRTLGAVEILAYGTALIPCMPEVNADVHQP